MAQTVYIMKQNSHELNPTHDLFRQNPHHQFSSSVWKYNLTTLRLLSVLNKTQSRFWNVVTNNVDTILQTHAHMVALFLALVLDWVTSVTMLRHNHCLRNATLSYTTITHVEIVWAKRSKGKRVVPTSTKYSSLLLPPYILWGNVVVTISCWFVILHVQSLQ